MARFDKFMANQDTASNTNGHVEEAKQGSLRSPEAIRPSTSPAANHVQERDSAEVDESSEVIDAASPKKKRKRSPLDDDAVFAAKLQAEENSRVARSTRGGGPKKAAPVKKKKTAKKKTADRIDAADDSDMDTEPTKKKVNRSGGFHVRYDFQARY